jgi:HPt (histidine-containing phosphotransfer) domain-containing protein
MHGTLYSTGLAIAWKDNDFSLIQNSAHTLKSSSAVLGARQMHRLCAELEASCRKKDLLGTQVTVVEIQTEYLELAKDLKSVEGF